MSQLLANNYRYRSSYAKTPTVLEVENLIEIQRRSYVQFLQPEVPAEERRSRISRGTPHCSSSPTSSRRRSTTSMSAVSVA